MSKEDLLGGRLIVVTGDITEMSVDAIVNAANSSLMGGGGVDGAIHRKGGSAILEACRHIRDTAYPSGLPTGEAVVTASGDLPCRHVIHTVGPIWHGGGSGERHSLARCYRRCLEEASALDSASLAFPAISTGVYGYPKEEAALVAYREVSRYMDVNSSPDRVYFVYFTQEDMDIFLAAIGDTRQADVP